MTNKRYTYIPQRMKSVNKEDPYVTGAEDIDAGNGKSQQVKNTEVDETLTQLSNEIDAVNKQDFIPVDTLPAVATADPKKIYRVVGEDSYTDYMVNASGDGWKTLATYSFPGIDDKPIAGSDNPVRSGGVQNELALGAVYDVSAKNPTAGPNNDGKWESLSALLSDANLNTLIPTFVRKGGMSIKFVCSSDNKYIQARLMAQSFTTDVTQWQDIDGVPTAGSKNLVESGGIKEIIDESIIDVTGVVDNFYENFIQYNTSGGAVNFDKYLKTCYIKVTEGDSFDYSLFATSIFLVIAAFDSSKNILLDKSITGAGPNTAANGTYTVASGVAYIQFVTLKTQAENSSVFKNNLSYQDDTILFSGRKNINGAAVFNFGGGPVVSPVSIDDYIGASVKKIPSNVYGVTHSYISVDAAGLYEISALVDFKTVFGNSTASVTNPIKTYHPFTYNGKKYIYVSASDVTGGVAYLIIGSYTSTDIQSVYYYITCDKLNDINVQLSADRTDINNIFKKFIVENEIQPENDPTTESRNQWIAFYGIKRGEKYYMTQFPGGYSITGIKCATDFGTSYLVGDVTEFNYDSESNTYSFKVPYDNITYLRISMSAINPDVLKKDFILTTVQTITNEDLSFCVEKGNPLKGKYVAVIGDSISTGADMNPYIKIIPSDVGNEVQSWVTFFDVYSDTSLTPTNKTIGGVTLTAEMIGTLQTFTPVAEDVGKEIGVADVYQQYLNQTFGWAYVLCEKAGAKLINASWSGASMCSGQGAQNYAASYAWHDCTIGRCKTRDNDGNTIVPDVIIIYRGTNDFSHVQGGNQYSQLDSDYNLENNGYPETDIYDTDKYGFYRAYYLTIKKLRVAYPKAVIYCATLNEFKRITFDRFPTRNGQYTLPDMNNAIRDIANRMGCGIVEFDKDGITFENCGVEYQMWPSSSPTHPYPNGHAVMAKKALSDISFVI